MSQVPSITLPSGSIPILGYGSGTAWFCNDTNAPINRDLVESTKAAIALGYLHLDTAEVYNTEKEIGLAIIESGVPREKFFVTSKVGKSIDDPYAAIKVSLDKLQLEYLDLYLIHNPFSITDMETTWAAMEKIKAEGLAKNIGVSNFRVEDIEKLEQCATVLPCVNQIEFNPYLTQPEIVTKCNELNIKIEAYSPLISLTHKTGGPIDQVVKDIAAKHNKTKAQVLLRWSVQRGNIVVTTSSKEERQKEYLGIFDFELSEQEVQSINEQGSKLHFRKYWTQPHQFGK
jgi:diketogulonate reductase-like aldo/keto reductase